jgi:hypothetical protein
MPAESKVGPHRHFAPRRHIRRLAQRAAGGQSRTAGHVRFRPNAAGPLRPRSTSRGHLALRRHSRARLRPWTTRPPALPACRQRTKSANTGTSPLGGTLRRHPSMPAERKVSQHRLFAPRRHIRRPAQRAAGGQSQTAGHVRFRPNAAGPLRPRSTSPGHLAPPRHGRARLRPWTTRPPALPACRQSAKSANTGTSPLGGTLRRRPACRQRAKSARHQHFAPRRHVHRPAQRVPGGQSRKPSLTAV